MKSLRGDETIEELAKRIEQHESALRLLPEGKVKARLREDVANLRSVLDIKQQQLLAVPGT